MVIYESLGATTKLFAELGVEKMTQAQGWDAGPGTQGKVMGEIRRGFSVTVVRGATMCLLERLTLCLQERRRRDRKAYYKTHQGQGVFRVGRAFVLRVIKFDPNLYSSW